MHVKKPWITTGILGSMHSKGKLHKINQKRFLINKVLHEISKRNKNITEKLLWIPKLIISAITSSRAKAT